jgi:hypothetical protein
MADRTGESIRGPLRLDFDHCLMVGLRSSVTTSDAGLPAHGSSTKRGTVRVSAIKS